MRQTEVESAFLALRSEEPSSVVHLLEQHRHLLERVLDKLIGVTKGYVEPLLAQTLLTRCKLINNNIK